LNIKTFSQYLCELPLEEDTGREGVTDELECRALSDFETQETGILEIVHLYLVVYTIDVPLMEESVTSSH
jgi:hypothetical protein